MPQEKKRKILSILQREFPLCKRPFLAIARKIGLKEKELLELLQSWYKDGTLRQISAIFNPQALGHMSSLFALRVPQEKLAYAIEKINNHQGVSHNYLRDHEYNLWFTLAVPPGHDLLNEAKIICEGLSDKEILYLPIIKTYKISVIFGVEENHAETSTNHKKTKINLSEEDIRMIKLLQEPLPLLKEPFAEIARQISCTEKDIFRWIKRMKKRKALRRFGALFKHHKLGYIHNVMVAWEVEESRVDEVAKILAKQPEITHCYLRKSYPHWRFNLYTMCHFQEASFDQKIHDWAKNLHITHYQPLVTVKELKKARLKLFYC